MPATVWKGHLSFGLVSFPVRLHSAGRAEPVRFHMLHRKDLSRVKEVWYCAEEDKPIDRADMVRGYEIRKEEYVVVEDKELEKAAPATAKTMDVLQFVKSDEVDPLYFETSYYVAPSDEGRKPYSLFLAALKETGQHAIAKVAMHRREHVVLIRPADETLVLHTLFYVQELHKANREKPPDAKFTAKELELAKSLIDHLAAPFKPSEFSDTYGENVKHMIEQKAKGKKITPVKRPAKAPVIDLMEALKRSVRQSKAAQAKSKPVKKSKRAKAA